MFVIVLIRVSANVWKCTDLVQLDALNSVLSVFFFFFFFSREHMSPTNSSAPTCISDTSIYFILVLESNDLKR